MRCAAAIAVLLACPLASTSWAAPPASPKAEHPSTAETVATSDAEARKVLQRGVDAAGGATAWASVRTVQVEGILVRPSRSDHPFAFRQAVDRVDQRLQQVIGSGLITGYPLIATWDCSSGWSTGLVGELTRPSHTEPAFNAVRLYDIGWLASLADSGEAIPERARRVTIEGEAMNEISLRQRRGGTMDLDFSSATGLLRRVRVSLGRMRQIGEVFMDVYLDDYQRDGAIVFPHRIEHWQVDDVRPVPQTVQIYRSVVINEPLNESLMAGPPWPLVDAANAAAQVGPSNRQLAAPAASPTAAPAPAPEEARAKPKRRRGPPR